MDQERTTRGTERFREVMGWEPPASEDPFVHQGVVGTVFAELWTREGLPDRDRRWISIACVCNAGNASAIRQHLEAAARSGDISVEELQEFVLHFAFYAGWPRAAVAHGVLGELMTTLAAER